MMSYTIDKNGNVVKFHRVGGEYVDTLLAICDMDKDEFWSFLNTYCRRAELMGYSYEEIKRAVNMMCRERSIMLADM